MSPSFWGRLGALHDVGATLLSGLAFVRRGRTAAAAGLRRVVPGVHDGFVAYCGLLVLLGMVTAGFALLPLGLLLLVQGLLHDSVDRSVVGGIVLCLVGLFYLTVPLLIIRMAARLALGRMQRTVDTLADRVEGKG